MESGAIAIFVVGSFVGGQIIDRNQSIYVKVDFGDFGEILLGKQLDLIDLFVKYLYLRSTNQ